METIRVPVFSKRLLTAWALIDKDDAYIVFKKRWHLTAQGYPATGRGVLMHRLILDGKIGGGKVPDHISRDKLDNRKSNLRIVPVARNALNTGARSQWRGRSTSSKYRGVSWHGGKKKWRANARLAGQQNHLGYYTDEKAAARVVQKFWRRQGISYQLPRD